MPTRSIWGELGRKFTKKYYGFPTVVHTTTVNHSGTIIAFAMDVTCHIYYCLLDFENSDVERGDWDVECWPNEPAQLHFPDEISQVGFSVAGTASLPQIHKDSGEENSSRDLPERDVDIFLSTTGRLTALAPICAFSDGKRVFLFRESISADDSNMLFTLSDGGVSGNISRPNSDFVLVGTNKVPIVNKTLLCDAFTLVGTELKKSREIRFRRSRHKTDPASNKDALGATDMEGRPFYLPTQELSFVTDLGGRQFSVTQLPTIVSGLLRWQIFAYNGTTSGIDSYNVEVSKDGFFNLAGSQLYTSPDQAYKGSVLERSPGDCPFTGQPLVPIKTETGRTDSCLGIVSEDNGYAQGLVSNLPSINNFSLEVWVKADSNASHTSGDGIFITNASNPLNNGGLEMNATGQVRLFIHDAYYSGSTLSNDWTHLALTFNNREVRMYRNGAIDKTVLSYNTSKSITLNDFRIGADTTGQKCFKGILDEARLWGKTLSQEEIASRYRIRLTGAEQDLVGYWPFNEGQGKTAFNKRQSTGHLTLYQGAAFVSSNCPAQQAPGSKSSFSFAGRDITGGVACCLYYQQENVQTGYSGSLKPMKKQARVLVTVGTRDTSTNEAGIASLDIGVSSEGRLAEVPGRLSVASLVPPPTASSDEIADKEQERYAKELEIQEWFSWYGTPHPTLSAGEVGNACRAAIDDLRRIESEYLQLVPPSFVEIRSELIQYDPSGLTICGGLLPFAKGAGGSHILPSASGRLAVYYQHAEDEWFTVAHFDTNVVRTRFLATSELLLLARTGGTCGATRVVVSASSSSDKCSVVICDESEGLVETYSNIPREPRQFASIINGTGTLPSDAFATNSLNLLNSSGKSFLVNASFNGDDTATQVPDGEVSVIPGKDSAWVADASGQCFYLLPTANLALPADKIAQTATAKDLTFEAWIHIRDTVPRELCVVSHVSPDCQYGLRLTRAINSGSYTIHAAKTSGGDENGNYMRSVQTKTIDDGWRHFAMSFAQSFALRFGVMEYIDCGKSAVLNITKELSVEIFLQLDTLNRFQGILGKGALGVTGSGVPYQVAITSQGKIQFSFEDVARRRHTLESTASLTAGKFHRIAVTKAYGQKKVQSTSPETFSYRDENDVQRNLSVELISSVEFVDFFELRMFIDGSNAGVFRMDGGQALGHDSPLEIGQCRPSPGNIAGMKGIISEVRIWDKALSETEVGVMVNGHEQNLVSWWRLQEGEGKRAFDFKEIGHGTLQGPQWTKTPDPNANVFELYFDGALVMTEPDAAWTWGADSFTLCHGTHPTQNTYGHIEGYIEEVRVWKTFRTEEQIVDNICQRLKGDIQDLLAYYPFDGESCAADATHLLDHGPLGNHIPIVQDPNSPRSIQPLVSTAPISGEIYYIQSALEKDQNSRKGLEVDFNYHRKIQGTPSACEYADMQRDALGNLTGVLKRCYSAVDDDGKWILVTGYKLGNLITEWIGQAQFDPQVIGFVEGAPPVPTENLIKGLVASADDAGKMKITESNQVRYTIGSSKESSWDASLEAGAKLSFGSSDLLILAPLGIGYAKQVTDISVDVGLKGKFDVSSGWTQQESSGTAINRSREMTVSTGGGFEDSAASNQLNPEMGCRALPGNAGLALVQSSTTDIFALRLAHSGALVSLRMLPNPDIPPDWNIISFPINPRYTKQGTLDGRVGFDSSGGAVLDPDYLNLTGYGEYSYYKPTEAYKLETRIRRDEQRLMTFYQDYQTGLGSTAGDLVSMATSAAASLMTPGQGQSKSQEAIQRGVSATEGTSPQIDNPTAAGKRDIANTYVWTADGGFFAETTETTDSRTEVTSGSFSLSGQVGASLEADIGIFSIGLKFEFEALLGASVGVTRTRSTEVERTFSMDIEVNVPGILQRYEKNADGFWVGEFDSSGNPLVPAGKVDAYRFKTFYLDSSSENFEDLFGKVIDPVWLATSSDGNAIALRQANQSEKKPACWRVFHRVTFVSRLLPPVQQMPTGSMERAMKVVNIDSNWQLIQVLDPFVKGKTGNWVTFSDTIRSVLQESLPEMIPHTTEIITYMAQYYGIPVGPV